MKTCGQSCDETVASIAEQITDDLHERMQFYDEAGNRANDVVLGDIEVCVKHTLTKHMSHKAKGERQSLRDEIDARRWRFVRDRYVKSIQHETNGTSAFAITLPRRRGTTIEAVIDELMGERGS